jgi:hypothetical protein
MFSKNSKPLWIFYFCFLFCLWKIWESSINKVFLKILCLSSGNTLVKTTNVMLLFGLKYSTFSFNLIRIWKMVSNTFFQLKEINLDILEEHPLQACWCLLNKYLYVFSLFSMKWWSFPKKLKFFSSQPALQQTSAKKHEWTLLCFQRASG